MSTAALPSSAPDAGPTSRRTFAIISHPDAGKTTLTEKLLLFGGAIRLAGQVKARGDRRRARSDWMKIEQDRGISVTTSVMTLTFGGVTLNLLDTPGHEDFSEDTYRTLTAVDSAVMVIDAARGIESQTRKLFEVCRLRNIPIMAFVNKMDRESRSPFTLIDEIADKLALDTAPVTWPVGQGADFRGCYDVARDRMLLIGEPDSDRVPEAIHCQGTDDPRLAEVLPAQQVAQLREEVALVREACPVLDVASYRAGHLAPVYFGSALRNFGVRELLDGLVDYAPPPRPQPAEPHPVDPSDPAVTGFVFKVQANMDPNHRDRVAFLRMSSGRLERNMKLHVVRTGKAISLRNPIFFFAQERELADGAVAGDIVGIPNHGTLRVGDTLTEGETLRFTGIPNFAPEILRRVRPLDAMKAKHLRRALESLAEEGVSQVFRPLLGSDWVVGVVGALQLDVLASRIEAEYGLPVAFEPVPYDLARWVGPEDSPDLPRFIERHRPAMAIDRDGGHVFLARNAWDLDQAKRNFPDLAFTETRERS